MHIRPTLIVETEHELMRVWVLTPNNVMEVLYVKHGLNLKLKDSIVHDEDLVTSKNNNTVDLLLSEFV